MPCREKSRWAQGRRQQRGGSGGKGGGERTITAAGGAGPGIMHGAKPANSAAYTRSGSGEAPAAKPVAAGGSMGGRLPSDQAVRRDQTLLKCPGGQRSPRSPHAVRRGKKLQSSHPAGPKRQSQHSAQAPDSQTGGSSVLCVPTREPAQCSPALRVPSSRRASGPLVCVASSRLGAPAPPCDSTPRPSKSRSAPWLSGASAARGRIVGSHCSGIGPRQGVPTGTDRRR